MTPRDLIFSTVTGNIGLDFFALGRLGDRRSEMISDNASFLRWIKETSLVPASAIESIRADNASAKLDAVFAEARAA